MSSQTLTLTRDCPARTIPDGDIVALTEGDQVLLHQELGLSFTVRTQRGALLRIEGTHAEALGLLPPGRPVQLLGSGPFKMGNVVAALDTVYDPEIPVSIWQLGLIYRCEEKELPDGGRLIEIDMSMTAPGCGMGDILQDDAKRVVAALPHVDQVDVRVVWDPPWSVARMSDIARLELGML